jgi:hypothetical protein
VINQSVFQRCPVRFIGFLMSDFSRAEKILGSLYRLWNCIFP